MQSLYISIIENQLYSVLNTWVIMHSNTPDTHHCVSWLASKVLTQTRNVKDNVVANDQSWLY